VRIILFNLKTYESTNAFGCVCFLSKVLAMPATQTSTPVVRLYVDGLSGFVFLEDPSIFQLNPHCGRCEQLIDSHSTVDKQFELAIKYVAKGARLIMEVTPPYLVALL
jgi:hypothetical protein